METCGDSLNGNTKSSRPTQLKKWFFTYNNPTESMEIFYSQLRSIPNIEKFVFQKEQGEKSGLIHYQGNIWLKKKMRWSEFNLSNKINFKKTRNEEASARYCCKSETRIGDPMFYPEYAFEDLIPIKTINFDSFYPWQKETFFEMVNPEINDRTINWIYEETGNVGKSAFVKYMCVKHNALLCDGGKKNDVLNLVFNNNMLLTRIIIFDLPRCAENHISYSAIESIKNGLVVNLKYETGVKYFNPPHIYIFANYPPDTSKLSIDRWVVREITKAPTLTFHAPPALSE